MIIVTYIFRRIRTKHQALRALSPSPCSRPTDSSRTTTPERTHATRANCTLAPPSKKRRRTRLCSSCIAIGTAPRTQAINPTHTRPQREGQKRRAIPYSSRTVSRGNLHTSRFACACAYFYQEESSSPSLLRSSSCKLAIRSGACTCTTSSKRMAALADLPHATVRDIVLGGGVGVTRKSIRDVEPRPRYCLPCDDSMFRWTGALMW
jgi:hypothetical protein